MTEPSSINTLSEFLMQAQTQYLVLDLGRGLKQIDNQQFFEWENQQAPCSFPRQDHAWFCIAFWNDKVSEQRFIWFVKLPLDENGLLIQAARNQFLEIIVTALGKDLKHQHDNEAQLPENPFVFSPSQQQLADCNAHIRKILNVQGQSSPERLTKVLAYMQAPNLHNPTQKDAGVWQQFSVQDISDFAIVAPFENTQEIIAENIHSYADPVLNCLLASLESLPIKGKLRDSLVKLHQRSANSNTAALCLRALSHKHHDSIKRYIETLVMQEQNIDIETCVVIAGRYWHLMENSALLVRYMHKVALLDQSYALFKGIYSDLVKVPSIRSEVLKMLRNPERTEVLSHAIGHLFSSK